VLSNTKKQKKLWSVLGKVMLLLPSALKYKETTKKKRKSHGVLWEKVMLLPSH
jgi:hypothetical protein